jgi:long-chain fatty acid transport protein
LFFLSKIKSRLNAIPHLIRSVVRLKSACSVFNETSMKQAKLQFNIMALSLLTASTAFATDGYFSHGYGVKTQATGGAGIALPQDSLAAASNPAGIAWTGNRIDGGLSWFSPSRNTEITGNGVPGVNGSYDGMIKRISGYPNWATPDS